MNWTRVYDVLALAAISTATVGALRGVWTDPSERVENLPKDARNNPAAYRSHYRHVIIHGGK